VDEYCSTTKNLCVGGDCLKSKQTDQSNQEPKHQFWVTTGKLERAFVVTSLLHKSGGVLYAGAVVNFDERRNEGVVFRSVDEGETWERTSSLEGCWSVNTVFESSEGILFAGGLRIEGEKSQGVVYESRDDGRNWHPVLIFPNGRVFDLMQTTDGHLYAATGWNGLLFKSTNGGQKWLVEARFGEKVDIHSIVQASNGSIFVAAKTPNGGQIMKLESGAKKWVSTHGLKAVSAVYDLLEGNKRLYAGVEGEDMGWIYQSGLDGLSWKQTQKLPDDKIKAVHCLLQGQKGEIFAGAERVWGSGFTKVFVTRTQGKRWEHLGEAIDLANTVYSLAKSNDTIYAATGNVYGNVYRCVV
jgi:photosystem II stability/assembly factor-like uncharacterized protein